MSKDIDSLVEAMTLEEQVSLLSGADAWSTPGIPRLGVGRLKVSDGPNGARGEAFAGGMRSAAFPVGISLGATWNPNLLREVGIALALEAKAKGAHMLLGPTVNIQRSVTNGRNFECYSEDPVLTATLAVSYIQGLQSKKIAATIKHFAGNESELDRTTVNSIIDEKTLREVYLLPFEWAVKKADTWGFMASYNRLNGEFAAENRWLLTTVLRTEWHYSGVVMSDWWGSNSTAPTIIAGLDLEMPGPPRDRGAKLVSAVKAGDIDASDVRELARHMLRLLDRTGAIDQPKLDPETTDDRHATRALIRRAGAEGIVLLKNSNILPLSGKGTIAVIGPNAKVAQATGGGSAQLNPYYVVSPWDGMVGAFGADCLSYAAGATNHRHEPAFPGELHAEFYDTADFSGPVVARQTLPPGGAFFSYNGLVPNIADPKHWSARFTGTYVPDADGLHYLGLFSVGNARAYVDGKLVTDSWTGWKRGHTFFEEGNDQVVGEVVLEAGKPHQILIEFVRRPGHIFDIPALRIGIGRPLGDGDIAAAAEVAATAETAVVFVGRNGEWDTEGWDLPDIALPGRQDALVRAVAAANPRTVVVLQTGGPVEMPWLEDVEAVLQAWYPGQEVGNAIADVLAGAAEPGGRLPQTFPLKWSDNPTWSDEAEAYPGRERKVRYAERLFVGYRHYERAGIAPLFPFGFGLSYTKFAISNLRIDDSRFEHDGEATVTLTVTNTGHRSGTEVIQMYVSEVNAATDRPRKELKAFAKISLEPGGARDVELALDARAFAHYQSAPGCWVVEPGSFRIIVGRHALDPGTVATLARKTGLQIPV